MGQTRLHSFQLVDIMVSVGHLQGVLPQLREGFPHTAQQLTPLHGMHRDLLNDLVEAQAVDVHHSVQALHLCFWQAVLSTQCLYTQLSKYAALSCDVRPCRRCCYEASLGCAEAACACNMQGERECIQQAMMKMCNLGSEVASSRL